MNFSMKSITAYLILTVIMAFSPADLCGEMIKVQALGDSITSGITSRGADGGYSYRYWLWQMFVDAGIEADFVGSLNTSAGENGDAGWPDYMGQSFDRDHEGHSGESTAFISQNLPAWLSGYDVDVSIIHIGHNDLAANISINETQDNIIQSIQLLQQENPNVIVLLAKVIPSNLGGALAAHVNAINALIDGIATTTTTGTSSVHPVDLNTGVNPVAITHDGIHPNAMGEQIMADRLFTAFQTHVVPEPSTALIVGLFGLTVFVVRHRATYA